MPGLTPEAFVIIVVIAVASWAYHGVAHVTEVVAHKTKCGVMRVVGKHCAPPKEDDTP